VADREEHVVVAGSFRTSANKPDNPPSYNMAAVRTGQLQPPPSIASRSVSSARTAGDVIAPSGT